MEIKLRTIVVGDIHGCIDEFDQLINKLNYNPNYDRLILLGDLIDRGEDSLAVVQRARELKLECLMGNHEYKFMKWFKSNKQYYDHTDYYTKFTDDDIDYIARMPTSIKIDNTILVHAGLKPGISLSNQSKEDLMYLRYTDLDLRFISLKKISKLGKEATDAHFWTEFWTGPESVVYGHNVHSLTDPLIEEVEPGVFCYGIDTGCCFGGRLTALVLETKQIIQVQAKKIYCETKFNI